MSKEEIEKFILEKQVECFYYPDLPKKILFEILTGLYSNLDKAKFYLESNYAKEHKIVRRELSNMIERYKEEIEDVWAGAKSNPH